MVIGILKFTRRSAHLEYCTLIKIKNFCSTYEIQNNLFARLTKYEYLKAFPITVPTYLLFSNNVTDTRN